MKHQMMGSVRLLADDDEAYFSTGEPWASEQRDADGSAERNQQGEHVDVIPESHADILDKTGLAHLATIGPNGEPQVSPVWYGWDGRYIRVSHTPDRQKYRNVRRDPRVALSITDPDDPYRRIEIRGRVERIDQDPDHAFIDSMAKKYTGADVYTASPPSQQRVILVIAPERANTMG